MVTLIEGPPLQDRTVTLSLVGRFRLLRGGREVDVPPSVQRLLAFLVVNDHALPRRLVAAALWPQADESHATSSLRSTLHRERQVSGLVTEPVHGALRFADEVVVDVRQLRELARRTIATRDDDRGLIAPGDLDVLSSAELLPGWDELWLVHERERLRLLCLHALEERARRLIERGHLAEAIETAQTVVQMEELRESAHRVLIRALVEEGNYAAALEQYRRFSAHLQAELGIEPSPMLDEVMSVITTG